MGFTSPSPVPSTQMESPVALSWGKTHRLCITIIGFIIFQESQKTILKKLNLQF